VGLRPRFSSLTPRGQGANAEGVHSDASEVLESVTERLRERQRQRPWLLGLTSIALAQALARPEATLTRILSSFVEAGLLVYRSGYYATADFTPELSADQQSFFARAFADPAGTPPAPLRFEDLRSQIRAGAGSIPDLTPALETLFAIGSLSKVGDFVYRGAHIAAIRAQLEGALHRHGPLTVAQFRTLTGTSRKYAVPLLEFFDATGVTRRDGNLRVLRQPAPEPTPTPRL
jgi:selenocysteine-specific elongation factor